MIKRRENPNVPEDVIEEIRERLAKDQQREALLEVTRDKLLEAISNKRWDEVLSMLKRDDKHVVAYHGYDELQKAQVNEVRSALLRNIADSEPTEDLGKLVGWFYHRAGIRFDEIPVILNQRLDGVLPAASTNTPYLTDISKEEMGETIRLLLALDTERSLDLAQKSIDEFLRWSDDRTPENADLLMKCFDAVLRTGSDHMLMRLLQQIESVEGYNPQSIDSNRIQTIIDSGLNASLGFILDKGWYQPSTKDLVFSFMRDHNKSKTSLEMTSGRKRFATSENPTKIIANSLGQLDPDVLIEALKTRRISGENPRINRAIEILIAKTTLPSDKTQRDALGSALLATNHDSIVAAAIKNGLAYPDESQINRMILDSCGGSLFELTEKKHLFTHAQIEKLLERDHSIDDSTLSHIVLGQLSSGYVPIEKTQLKKLAELNPSAVGLIAQSLKRAGVDVTPKEPLTL